MEDFFESLVQHVGGGFFAADAPRAEHGDFLVFFGVAIFFDVGGEIAEGSGIGVERAFEGSQLDFVIVSGVDQEDFGVADEACPVFRGYVGADCFVRVCAGDAEGDDFLFEADLHAVEGLFGGLGFFVIEVFESGIGAEVDEYGVDAFLRACYGAVYAFFREEDHAFYFVLGAGIEEYWFEFLVVRQRGEFIHSGDCEGGCFGHFFREILPLKGGSIANVGRIG